MNQKELQPHEFFNLFGDCLKNDSDKYFDIKIKNKYLYE